MTSAERTREMNRGVLSDGELMTVGELSRRTGLTIKAIREYERLGLIYSAGRSEGGYRLFDRSALWCAEVISTLRSVGVTVKEIAELGNVYLSRPDDPLGPQVAALLDRAERRTERRITELSALLGRLREYRQRTPRRSPASSTLSSSERTREKPRMGLDSAPGGRPHHRERPERRTLMSTKYVEETTALIREVESQELIPHAIRLLSEGEPVSVERLATASRLTAEEVETMLRDQVSAERDDQGRLVGFALTLRATPHRYTTGGHTFYAWCATDALMLPVILGEPAVVESTCAQTGEPIRIEVTPEGVERVDPPEAVMSAVRPGGRFADVRASTCQFGHFFRSPETAAEWTAEHPDGYVHSVEKGFELDREVIERLGWDARSRQADASQT